MFHYNESKYLNTLEFVFILALHLWHSTCTIFVSHCVKSDNTQPHAHNLEFKYMLRNVAAPDKVEFLKHTLAWCENTCLHAVWSL